MTCLLPQFKCSPDAFAVNVKSRSHSFALSSRNRDAINFRTQCILTATTVLELEELQLSPLEAIPNSVSADISWARSTTKAATLDLEKLPSLDTHPVSIAGNNPLTYIGSLGSPSEVNLGASFDKDTLLTSEEAVINAAASETLALAKAAVKVAKDAALMVSHHKSTKPDSTTSGILHEINNSIVGKSQVAHLAESLGFREAEVTEIGLGQNYLVSDPLAVSDDVEPSAEELEFLEAQLSECVAVRSKRQPERKARRTRAVENAATNIVPMKSGSSSTRKKKINFSDPLRQVRRSTSSKLLTASEERVLSEGIQVLLKLEKLKEELTQRIGGEPTLNQWAAVAGVDRKTLQQQLNYGVFCKNKMVKSNIRLVISIAKNYVVTGMELQDLIQEGCRGLMRGAEKFDASKGFKFSTYAHWWIKQSVRRAVTEGSRLIRIPYHMADKAYKVREARKQLLAKTGRVPDDEEVSKVTGLSMKRIAKVNRLPKRPLSLDRKVGPYKDLNLADMITHPEAKTAEELLDKQFMRQDLAKLLDSLNPRERQVVRWRFGFDGGRTKSLQEIGELMHVSRERVRQIQSCAFRKMKSKKRIKSLQEYVKPKSYDFVGY